MDILWPLITLVTSYLIGSISTSRLVFRLLAPGKPMQDLELRVPDSDDVYTVTATGASAASMVLGTRAGCVIGLLDMLKAAVPTLLLRLLRPDQPIFLLAALAVMAGHNWPIFHRFKGGRGVSAVYGSLFVIDPLGAFVVSFAGLVFGLVVVRDFIVAYLSGLWLLIPWLWWRTGQAAYVAYAIAANVLFTLAMIPDLQQYIRVRQKGRIEMDDVMEMTPMGRGMLKIMDKLHLRRERRHVSH